MDHSVRGYLSRRSQQELEQIIAMCEHAEDKEFYEPILEMALHFLEERINEKKEN